MATELNLSGAKRRRLSIPVPRPLWFGLAAIVIAAIAAVVQIGAPIYRQRAAFEALDDRGASIAHSENAFSKLLLRVHYTGAEFFDDVVDVDFSMLADEEDLRFLSGLPRIQMLQLVGCPVGDAGLRHLKGLQTLRVLDLSDTHITDGGMAHLRGLNLSVLDLNETQITDAGLAELGRFPDLQELDLKGTNITDAGLAHLKRWPRLQRVDLSGTAITDSGLAALNGLRELERLWLEDTRVTDVGIAQLQRVLPRLTIEKHTELSTSLADFDHDDGGADLFGPQPWHTWKTALDGQPRVIRFDGARLIMIPGQSRGAVHLFDENGGELANWAFSTGWRINLVAASFEPIVEGLTNVLVLQTEKSTNGRNVARQYFAFSGDRLRFIRMEDDSGKLLQNDYHAPVTTLGIVPEAKELDEWVKLLESENAIDILGALTFIGGLHVNWANSVPWWHDADGDENKMAWTLRRSARIGEIVTRLKDADHPWVREAADVASAELSRIQQAEP